MKLREFRQLFDLSGDLLKEEEELILRELNDIRARLIQYNAASRALKEDRDSIARFYEVGDMLNDALVKYNAAKKGLGISNKLKDPAQRTVHRSRIMANLNSLRALVRKIEKSL